MEIDPIRKALAEMGDKLDSSGNVTRVYGEPVKVGADKIIVPVAQVKYGFGVGASMAPSGPVSQDKPTLWTRLLDTVMPRNATGGGAGLRAEPIGVFEITPEETRFVPVGRPKLIAQAFVGGVLFGIVWSWLRRRR